MMLAINMHARVQGNSAPGRAQQTDVTAPDILRAVSNPFVIGPRHAPCPPLASGGAIGERPAFYLDDVRASRLVRRAVSPVPRKRYIGVFRVHQALRHISVAINTTMKIRHRVDPLEVQASVIGDVLHVSSNFHGHHIVDSLRHAYSGLGLPESFARRVPKKQVGDWSAEIESRRCRHIENLRRSFGSPDSTRRVIEKARAEIILGRGTCEGTNLSNEEMAVQSAAGLQTIFTVLDDLRRTGQSSRLTIHYPYVDPALDACLPAGVTQTTHAEQSIEEHLATHGDAVYREAVAAMGLTTGKHVIVPIAGRFVPCAACAEVEHQAKKESGIFDPSLNRFVLCRGTRRVGRAFPNEVQHFALSAICPGDPVRANARAADIRDRFIHGTETLCSHDTPVVLKHSLDTESESSSDDDAL